MERYLSSAALMQAVDAEPWDPSIKALTQFPSVLNDLASNLSWTSALGEAYHTQTADVMSAVQALRAKAYAAGNLKSGSQITVVQESPQVIVIQPANPQVIYVPQYNPAVVYGTPYVTPGYSTAAVVATGVLAFGAGIAVGAAISGGCCGWSYSSWNCNWHGGTVVYGHTTYYGNNAWHGGYYGSSATAYGPYRAAHKHWMFDESGHRLPCLGCTLGLLFACRKESLFQRRVHRFRWMDCRLSPLGELRELGVLQERSNHLHAAREQRLRIRINHAEHERCQGCFRDQREWPTLRGG